MVAAERAAAVLREAHPEAEPYEVEWPTLATWVADAGIDPHDDALVASVLVAWDRLLS